MPNHDDDESGAAEPLDERRSGAPGKQLSDPRTAAHKDHDRIFFSDEFARLAGVTQIATTSLPTLKNRLTHSYRVEQVARSISLRFAEEGLSEHAVTAAALAHDLGHAPFGHTGEAELHKLLVCEYHRKNRTRHSERQKTENGRPVQACPDCHLIDGFEGNAQTFRMLVRLGAKREAADAQLTNTGLDLTRRVLRACSKYPWTRGGNDEKLNKWGAYDDDAEALEWVMGKIDSDGPLLEAQAMDLADDIANAVHDVEDFFRLGMLPLNELKLNEPNFVKVLDYIVGEAGKIHSGVLQSLARDYKEYVESESGDFGRYPTLSFLNESILSLFPKESYVDSRQGRVVISEFRSEALTGFLGSLKCDGARLEFEDPNVELLVEFLKQLAWHYVIDDPQLAAIRSGQRGVIRTCYRELSTTALEVFVNADGDWRTASEHDKRTLHPRLIDYVRIGKEIKSRYTPMETVRRAVVDYICSLTDQEAYALAGQLRGYPDHAVVSGVRR